MPSSATSKTHELGREISALLRFADQLLEQHRNCVNVMMPCRDIHDEVVDGVIVNSGDDGRVDLEERGSGEPCKPLVAVDESMILDDGLEKGGRLCRQIRVGVRPECSGLRTSSGGAQESDVSNWDRLAQEVGREGQQILE